MKYSLLSRFRGCFEGMIAADQLSLWASRHKPFEALSSTEASRKECSGQFRPSSPKLHHWHPGIPSTVGQVKWQPSPWVDLAIQVAEALIQEKDWTLQTTALETARLSASGVNNDKLAIATLPVALFFHDDLLLQQQRLRQTVQAWGGTPSMEDWVTVFGHTIAQVLKEQLDPAQFISHLLSSWSGADPTLHLHSPQILTALELLRKLIEQGIPSEAAILKLEQLLPQDDKTIVLVLYYFLATPDSWQISVLHAARLLPAYPMICALTGGLSGTYNSHSSLPLAWKVAARQSLPSMQSSQSLFTCTELSTRLLAAWSGILDTSRPGANMLPVASPRISYSRLL